MAQFPNKIEVKCKVCENVVPVGTGWTFGPPWITKCKPCAGIVEDTGPLRILFRREGEDVTIKPSGRLGADFSIYRTAVDGAHYDAQRKLQVAPLQDIIRIVDRVRSAGFLIDLDPEVVAAVEQQAIEIRNEVEAAKVRAEEIDEKFKARGLSLYPFQKIGAAWMASRRNLLLADEMGLGKTIQALAAMPEKVAVLVVSPAVGKGVWRRETAKWREEFKVSTLSGRTSFRWPEPGEAVVTNYDILPEIPKVARHTRCGRKPCLVQKMTDYVVGAPPCAACQAAEAFLETCPEGVVIVADEAHALKNPDTNRSRSFRALSRAAQATGGRVWGMTATPLLNEPGELWSVLMALGCAIEAFGSWHAYKTLMGGFESGFAIEWGTPNSEQVQPRLSRVSMRRLRAEVLPDLPAKTREIITVDIDKRTQKLCDKLLKELEDKSESGTAEGAWEEFAPFWNEATGGMEIETNAELTIAHETRRRPVPFERISEVREALAIAKIPALLDLVETYEDQKEPIVVFSAHRAPVLKLGERKGWAVITGDTRADERSRIEEAFQRGELRGVACTIRAGGVAITLTRACHAIFVDRDWTPGLNLQAEDRICRIGQTRGCIIKLLCADHSIDEMLDRIIVQKMRLIEASVDASRVRPGDVVRTDVVEGMDFEILARTAVMEATKFAEQAAILQQEADRRAEEAEERRRVREAAMEFTSRTGGDVDPRAIEYGRRGPDNEVEVWAARGITTLASNDPDRAMVRNDVGFNSADNFVGHWLASQLHIGWTEKQWTIARSLCRKYWRQIGPSPDPQTGEPVAPSAMDNLRESMS